MSMTQKNLKEDESVVGQRTIQCHHPLSSHLCRDYSALDVSVQSILDNPQHQLKRTLSNLKGLLAEDQIFMV